MALGIEAGIKPTPIVLILDLHDDLGAGRFGARIMRIGILDDNVGALGPDAAGSLGGLTQRPNSSSRAEPSMIMPLPKVSCACATVPFSPGTTRCFSNPKALHSHSIAAFASRYRIAGMTVDTVFLGMLGILSSSAANRSG
jgi:hypothetical protein